MKETKESTTGDLRKAEASGQIRTMPTAPVQQKAAEPEKREVIDNPQDLSVAIGQAQMEGLDHLEVSERLFAYLLRNNKSNYLTYGKPGIKLYREGTKRKLDREDMMSAEDRHDLIGRRFAEERAKENFDD